MHPNVGRLLYDADKLKGGIDGICSIVRERGKMQPVENFALKASKEKITL
jgi:hypothetical protein